METMILQNGVRLTVFNEQANRRLAAANAAIRSARRLTPLPPISAVYLDSANPRALLRHAPSEALIEVMSGFHSRRLDDGRYQVRGTAFGVDWQWLALTPLLVTGPVRKLRDEDTGVSNEDAEAGEANPLFGGRVLRLVGDGA